MSASSGKSQPTRFQARTIAYVVKRFWEDADPARRFLVADEVGLGKTMVAREVLAEALRRRPGERIDIVYLCSSQPVASQNLKRLTVHGRGSNTKATRLTLLATEPTAAHDSVRYFALTPDTSFKVTGRSGTARERALIYTCLRSVFRSPGFLTVMQQVSDQSWGNEIARLKSGSLDLTVVRAFRNAVRTNPALEAEARLLANAAMTLGVDANARKLFKKRRDSLVGQFRRELALRSAQALASHGLVIVDEFQRFSSLFDVTRMEEDFSVRLAERLLTQDIPERRVLLLSATPYRLPGGELAADEKPYADFVALVRFLAGSATSANLSDALDRYSRALRASPPDPTRVVAARNDAAAILCKVMCRTERTGAAVSANAMVKEDVRSIPTELGDLGGALAGRRISQRLQVRDPAEYWKSAPYFLDFMREYQFRDAAINVSSEKDRRFVAQQARRGDLLLDRQTLRRLDPIVSPSPRLRDLIKDALPDGAERLLWLPPSLPYLTSSGQFARATPDLKRLVFTEWRLAPDAITAMTSYEIERRLAADLRSSHTTRTRSTDRSIGSRHKRFGALGNMLRLGRAHKSAADPTLSMVPLALLLAGRRMASWGDPLPAALAAGRAVDRGTVLDTAAGAIRSALKSLPVGTGRVDDRWYWAAPLLLEGASAIEDWLGLDDPLFATGDAVEIEQLDRVKHAISSILGNPGQLGRRPRNLVKTLSKLAVAGPGNCAYRSLARTAFEAVSDAELRRGAFRIARGFQSLFNQSEAAAAVQLEHPGRKRVFWDQALDYCLNGNLASLLDEHLHFEADGLAMYDGTAAKKVEMAAASVHAALTLRRSAIDVRGLERRGRTANGTRDVVRLRARHGARFAEVKEADGSVSRLDAVRAAFNSPFRPFVLASTAVGQEGLDFHPWCHAVVHWNLPRSPVELEQREGRVHRYKGHAVRLNVARTVGLSGLASEGQTSTADPWRGLFELAGKLDEDNELSPCWIFENGPDPTRIRRIIPFLNFSREAEAWPRLRARLATYRLALGLPRADDLLDALEQNGVTEDQAAAWRIDLRPPPIAFAPS